MTLWTRTFALTLLARVAAAPAGYGADIDRAAVDFTTPADIKWVNRDLKSLKSLIEG